MKFTVKEDADGFSMAGFESAKDINVVGDSRYSVLSKGKKDTERMIDCT